jgi:splicing factor 3B subunit 2
LKSPRSSENYTRNEWKTVIFFRLPDFIEKTGIAKIRQSLLEREQQKDLKAKLRERARPKTGKMDIDFNTLHDAFFKWQTKPKNLTK